MKSVKKPSLFDVLAKLRQLSDACNKVDDSEGGTWRGYRVVKVRIVLAK